MVESGIFPKVMHGQLIKQKQLLMLKPETVLKQIYRIEQKLKHPEYNDMVTGFDGMKDAHRILQEKKAVGLLIGGLANAVWNKKRTKAELSSHKDVDVMVLEGADYISRFEGGIDWWLPEYGTINCKRGRVREEKDAIWYVNGNGVTLNFSAILYNELTPGLYIPDPNWIIRMRWVEACGVINRKDIEDNTLLYDRFKTSMKRKIKEDVPTFIYDGFYEYIMAGCSYGCNCTHLDISLDTFDISALKCIKNKGLEEIIS